MRYPRLSALVRFSKYFMQDYGFPGFDSAPVSGNNQHGVPVRSFTKFKKHCTRAGFSTVHSRLASSAM